MRTTLRRAVVGASALAIVGSALALGAGVAQAAVTPGWTPDANAVGGLSFYDAAGHQITSGSITDSPMASYYVGSGGGINSGNNKAFQAFSTPVQGANSATWPGTQIITSTQSFPVALPGDLTGATNAVVASTAVDGSLSSNQIAAFPNASAVSGYQGLYEVRIYTTGGAGGQSSTWYSATVQVTGTTWAQVFPVQTSTTTTLAALTSPIVSGTNVVLNATVAPATAGKVQFFDGGVAVGSPQTVTGGSGAASVTATAPAIGSHVYNAVFTPTPGSAGLGSTSSNQTVVVQAPANPTTTTLAVNTGSGQAFTPVTFTATVAPAAAAGTVTFKDGATTIGTTAAGTTPFVLTTSSLGQGAHSVTATFNPTDTATYNGSTSGPQGFSLTAPACAGGGTGCIDTQNIQADIPAGTIVINTPYHAGNALDVPLTLDPTATFFTGSAPFASIKITDTRAGNLPWDAKAQAGNLVNGANAIDGQNVGLTNILWDNTQTTTVSTAAGNLTVTNAPAATPPVAAGTPGTLGLGGAQHTLIHANQGVGTITYKGTLTINAPTNLPAGTYAGTITFTVG